MKGLSCGQGAVPGRDDSKSRLRPRDPWVLNTEVFTSLEEAQVLAADWRDDYNANHPHSALGVMLPARFAASWQRIGNTNGLINPELSLGVDR
jgi:transposase InsO family protein